MTAQARRQEVQTRDGHPQPVLLVRRCRRGVRPDHVEMRIRLVEVELVEVGDRVHQRQPGEVLADPGREGMEEHRHGPGLAVEGEAEGVVREKPGRLGPVTSGLQMADGVGGVTVVGEPPRGDPVELRDLRGDGTAELQPEQAAEHVVVAEPGTSGVEGQDERVGVLELQQDPFRSSCPGEQVGQLAVDPVQQGSTQQQSLYLWWLPVQHFGHQVLGDSAIAAGELGDEPFRVRVPGQGQDGQSQPGRPAFGPLVQRGHRLVGQRDPGGREQLASLVLGEEQLRRADLGQLSRQPELMQAQRKVAAGGYDHMDVRGEVRQQGGELLDGLGGGQLMQVVDDQDAGIAGRRELGQHLVHHGPAVVPGRRGRGLGATDRTQQGEPEQLGVVLAGLDRHEGDPPVLALSIGPPVQ